MVILTLVEELAAVADGDVVRVAVSRDGDVELARAWCERSGNTLVDVHDGHLVVRRGRAPDPLNDIAPDRRPGARLWMYTNFDCNLACDYCCVRSSPRTPRRALGLETIRQLAEQAPAAGVTELLLTGGEPFLLPDLDQIAAACIDALPTTLLTNGMLFHGRRLERLRRMDRQIALQISLDSATPARHDEHRGAGTWQRAVDGIRTAGTEGFRVRVAATLVTSDLAEEGELRDLLTTLRIAPEDQILRPLARRGFSEEGLVLTQQTLQPEVTVTADGVYWHPVGADDEDQFVTAEVFPLADVVATVQEQFRAHRRRADAAARSFPCA